MYNIWIVTKKNKKFIDLFAGIGGFHLAFHKLGLECVLASEIDPIARISYERNFNKISPNLFNKGLFNEDIYDLKTNDIPDFDICCAGFPCQPFSQIGKQRIQWEFWRWGNLFFEIERILKIKDTEHFSENVKHIINHDNGKTFRIIQERIRNLNYSFYYKKIKACDFNPPQLRPRTFMVGFRDEKPEDELNSLTQFL